MELELYFSQPVRDIAVVDTAHEDLPVMCVVLRDVRWLLAGLEGLCFAAVDERAMDLDTAHALGTCWGWHYEAEVEDCFGRLGSEVELDECVEEEESSAEGFLCFGRMELIFNP